jgi:hypothetical protein
MKFDKLLNHTSKTFYDITLQQSLLPYKFWKKYIKQHKEHFNHEDIYVKLNDHCHRVDKTFNKELENKLYPSSCCFKPKVYSEIVPDELIRFSEINQMALYKICKKLEKNGASNLLNYYTQAKTKRMYKFLGTHELTYLKIQQDPSIECPICMEDSYESMVILDCEHYVCLNCIIQITHLEHKKGTLYNRLLASSFSCPICRSIKPLKEVTKYHFYPKPPKNFLRP